MGRPLPALCLALALGASSGFATGEDRALPVTVRPAGELLVAIERSAPGTAVALQRTEIAARLAAPIERFEVEVGTRVGAAAVVARLECLDAIDARAAATARLREAAARARLARLQLERLRRLRAEAAAAADELDRAEAEHGARVEAVEARTAELARARRDVARCQIRTPAGGVIAARHRSVGDFVQPGTPLLTLVAEDDLEARAEVTPEDAESLLQAPEIVFRAGGFDFPLARPRRTGVVDPATRTEEIRLAFTGARPLPGRPGRVHWRSTPGAIPADLLVTRDGQLGVIVAQDGRARFHPLPGAVEGRPAASDLAADTSVVIQGRYAATDGARLDIIE